MAFITDGDLVTYAKATLHKASLVSQWTTLAGIANGKAYRCIVGALAARGYTKAQIDAWDEGADFNYSIGLYWLLTHGAAIEAGEYTRPFIEAFDLREELQTVVVTTGGEFVEPAGTRGVVSTGALDTDGDLFKLDPDDPRRDDLRTEF